MDILKKQYLDLYKKFTSDFKLKEPLFYNNVNSLRFELYDKAGGNKKKVLDFLDSIFDYVLKSDTVFILCRSMLPVKHKADKLQKYVNGNLCKFYEKTAYFNSPDPDFIESGDEVLTLYIIDKSNICLNRFLKSLCSQSKDLNEVFLLIDLDNYAALHVYDDRGMDVIAGDLKFLKNLYEKYNYWIIEHNRQDIEKKLGLSNT